MKYIVNPFAKLARFFGELNAKAGKTSVRTLATSLQSPKFGVCSNSNAVVWLPMVSRGLLALKITPVWKL